MTMTTTIHAVDSRRAVLRRRLFLGAAALQFASLAIFVFDISAELIAFNFMVVTEVMAVAALAIGLAVTLREYRLLLRRNRSVERELGAASGAFQEMLEEHFTMWGLTPAERDVALMSIKGLSNGDIAALRETRVGTIKAQSAAIYRKAGVSSRAELISVVIEDLIAGIGLPGDRRHVRDEGGPGPEA